MFVGNLSFSVNEDAVILMDFPQERAGFDLMIEWMREGKDINAASDGSRLDDGRVSAGWLMWTMSDEIDDEGQLTRRQIFLMGSTIRVDGRLDDFIGRFYIPRKLSMMIAILLPTTVPYNFVK